jgi:hypothetical protein
MTEVEKTVMFSMPNLLSGQLACISGSVAGRSWDLSAGTFTIGRLDEHDLCLVDEPGVSKTHAKIVGQGDRYVLVDCESRNGTILNGTNVQKADLYDGDEIRICGCVLRFQQRGGPARPRSVPEAPRPQPAPPPAPDEFAGASAPTFSAASPGELPPSWTPAAAGPTAGSMPGSFPGAFPGALPGAMPGAFTGSMPDAMVGGFAGAVPADAPAPVGPSAQRVLLRWYAAGFVAMLVIGGAASAAIVATAAPPVVATTADPPTAQVPSPAGAAVTAADAPPGVGGGIETGGGPGSVPGGAATGGVDAGGPGPDAGGAAEPVVELATTDLGVSPPALPPAVPGGGPQRQDGAGRDDASAVVAANDSVVLRAVVDGGGGGGAVRTKTGGRVATVDVIDGEFVQKGQTLLTFAAGADQAEIQTLQDRIASLENAEDEEARRDLRAAKTKLAALEGGRGAPPLVAPIDGRLRGFTVVSGAVLRPGDVVGRIGDGEVPTRVRVTLARGMRVTTGQTVTLLLKSGGTADGTVVSTNGQTAVIATGTVAGDVVEGVRF